MFWRVMIQPIESQEEADAIAERITLKESTVGLSDVSEKTGLSVYVIPVEGEPD